MSYLVIMPSIDPAHTEACLATCALDVDVIDNSVLNLGVAASWNVGIDRLGEREWLVILSAGVRFGAPGGADFIAALDTTTADVVEAQLGWHLIAFHRDTIGAVGRFDENFYPAYWEDNDYGYRIRLWAPAATWPKVDVEAHLAQYAHGIATQQVYVDHVRLERYYADKWGGQSAAETYQSPFGLDRPASWWPGCP